MKTCCYFYIIDCVSETAQASFMAVNVKMAERNFKAFLDKLPDGTNKDDFILVEGNFIDVCETYNEILDFKSKGGYYCNGGSLYN